MYGRDRLGELRVDLLALGRGGGAVGVEGGAGDLQQHARPGDVAALGLLRLDERVHRRRVSFAKKVTSAWPQSKRRPR